ncbi:MAG: DNA endonuclease SmrA, partial [Natronospirillum sp.]
MPPEDEDDIFAREMAGVRRMRLEPRVRVRRANAQTADTLAQRRIAAVAVAADDCDGLSASHVEWVEPTDVLTWRGDGVAHGVFKRLKQGGYALDARLDLHKHTVEQARKAIVRFILDCQKYDVRS